LEKNDKHCQNKTVAFLAVKNSTKIVIEILQRSAVTQNALGGLDIYSFLQISYSVCLPKIMKIG